MKLRRSIKRQAREALRGRLSTAALLFLVWALLRGLVTLADGAAFRLLGYRLEWFGGAGIPLEMDWLARPGAVWASAAIAVVRLVLLCPLKTGAAVWFTALMKGEPLPPSVLFWPYGNRVWLRSLGVRLYTGALSWTVALAPLAGVGAALWLLRERLGMLSAPEVALASALVGVAVLGWLLVARAYAQRFSMTTLLLGPDYGCTVAEAILLSVEYTRGHRWRLVWLDLSFLPWFAACLLAAPALYVLPYYTACRVGYHRFLYHRQPRAVRERSRAAAKSAPVGLNPRGRGKRRAPREG